MPNLIQWPKAVYWDKPWNPIQGCHSVSPACDHCYARAFADRYKQSFEPHATKRVNPPYSGVVFCGNATDMFGEWRECVEMAEDVIRCAKTSKNADTSYLWCTKRVERMNMALKCVEGKLNYPGEWFANNYFGFTAENQEWYERRVEPFSERFPTWANGWISAEPLLGRIGFMFQNPYIRDHIKWVAVGAESGPNRRPCELMWIEEAVEQCRRFNVPVFVKQICLPDGKFTKNIEEFPEHLRIRQVPWKTKGGCRGGGESR